MVALPEIDWAELERQDLLTAAWHEAGHIVAAEHFGVFRWAQLIRTGASLPLLECKAYGGRTYFLHTTLFRKAVIGWAGPMAESLFLDPEEACIDQVWCDWELIENSATDSAAIDGHPQRWRSCKTAWRILEKRWAAVASWAAQLQANALRTPRVPIRLPAAA